MHYLPVCLYVFLFSCTSFSSNEKDNVQVNAYQEESVTISQYSPTNQEKEHSIISSNNIDSMPPIDTASLKAFWDDFKNNLRKENQQKVIAVFEFPIHAIFPVLFRYAHDCDTLTYIKNEKKYSDFDIDKSNIAEYYDFFFTDVLKEIIYQTSVNDLLSKGYKNSKILGLTYIFFPKDYNVKVSCPNDHNIKFHLTYQQNHWKIEIGGL